MTQETLIEEKMIVTLREQVKLYRERSAMLQKQVEKLDVILEGKDVEIESNRIINKRLMDSLEPTNKFSFETWLENTDNLQKCKFVFKILKEVLIKWMKKIKLLIVRQ